MGKVSGFVHLAGPGRVARDYVTVPASQLSSTDSGRTVTGLRGEYFDNPRLEGRPRLVRTDQQVSFGWTLNSPGRGIPFDWYSVRWTGQIVAPAGGTLHQLGIEGNDGYRLYVDGRLVIDDWQKRSYSTAFTAVSFAPGSTHDIRLEFFETGRQRPRQARLGRRGARRLAFGDR